jgi:predicted HTH transcriptional regulator
VRELDAVFEQGMIFARGRWVSAEDLSLREGDAVGVEEDAAAARQALSSHEEGLSSHQREALRIAAGRRGEVRRRDLVTQRGISGESARRELSALVARGMLHRVGSGRGARYVLRAGATPAR